MRECDCGPAAALSVPACDAGQFLAASGEPASTTTGWFPTRPPNSAAV